MLGDLGRLDADREGVEGAFRLAVFCELGALLGHTKEHRLADECAVLEEQGASCGGLTLGDNGGE
jgi:hypothetical protein